MIGKQYDIALAAFVALCIMLGGASGAGEIPNFLLQVLAVGLIVFGYLSQRGERTGGPQPLLRLAAAGLVAVALLQFLPLPPSLWSALPGRDFVAGGFDLIGIERPLLSYSLAPFDSLASLVWLLPAIATAFLATRLLDLRGEWIAGAICLVAAASVPLGAIQVVYGSESGWYLYERSGFGQGAGFFANGNHQGTFLLIAIALLAALHARLRGEGRVHNAAFALFLAFVGLVLVIGVILTGSMAAIGLLLVVLPASYVLMTPRVDLPGPWVLAAAGVVGLAAVLALAYSGMEQAGSGLQADGPMSRADIAATTLSAAWSHFPFGTGIGTFEKIYPMFEDPTAVSTTFINHAHNDYVEILLETGLPGVLVVALFLAWWVRRSLILWTGDRKNHFALAASLAVGVVLAHSVVDYPLRTAAISTLFALCVALMARSDTLWERSRRQKHRSDRRKKKKISL